MNNKIVFYAAIPRTGSSLLSSILNQNDEIHSEGQSPLCEMIWQTFCTLETDLVKTAYLASHRNLENAKSGFFSLMFNEYYKEKNNKIIFDKDPSWILHGNYSLIEEYFCSDPKIIVTTRNTSDIVRSYINVYVQNGLDQTYAENKLILGQENSSGALLRYFAGLAWAQTNKKNNLLLIDYDDLILDTEKQIEKIYDYVGIKSFKHTFSNIHNPFLENQDIVLRGLSEVRPKISRRKINIDFSDKLKEKIKEIDDVLCLSKKDMLTEEEEKKIINFYNISVE